MPDAVSQSVPEWWTDVPGYQGVYQVSHLGRIRCIASGRGRRRAPYVLTPNANDNGYLYVTLMTHGYRDVRAVHQLVAAAFLGPCPTDQEVDHIDTDKHNNRATNLRYLTYAANSGRYARLKAEVGRAYRTRERM